MLLSIAFSLLFFHVSNAWNTADLDQFINKVLECRHDMSAIGVAVVQLDENDNVVNHYTQGYGFQDPTCRNETCAKVDSTTRFCIGSCSKQFTGAIVGATLKKAYPSIANVWDMPLSDILGPSQTAFFDGSQVGSLVTVRDVLSHRMGIARCDFAWVLDMEGTRSDILSKAYTLNPMGPLPAYYRSTWNYNNWMVALGGHVAETVSKKSWEELVKEHFYEPLNMTGSGFYTIDFGKSSNYTKLGIWDNGTWISDPRPVEYYEYLTPVAAAGGLCTNPEDMAKYMAFLLKSTASSSDMISRDVIADAMKPSSSLYAPKPAQSLPNDPIANTEDSYGFGWFLGNYRGYRSAQHAGDIDGFHSNLFLLPDAKIGIFVTSATNLAIPDQYATQISYYAADLLLGLEPWLNTTMACTLPPPPVFPTAPTDINCKLDGSYYSGFQGTYRHPMLGDLTISWNTTTNELSFAYGKYATGLLCSKTGVDNSTLYVNFAPSFLSVIVRIFSFSNPFYITFNTNEHHTAQSATFTALEPQGSPVFINVAVPTVSPTASTLPPTASTLPPKISSTILITNSTTPVPCSPVTCHCDAPHGTANACKAISKLLLVAIILAIFKASFLF